MQSPPLISPREAEERREVILPAGLLGIASLSVPFSQTQGTKLSDFVATVERSVGAVAGPGRRVVVESVLDVAADNRRVALDSPLANVTAGNDVRLS